MVVATEDETTVSVHYVGGVSLPNEHFTLNRHQVFTRDPYHIEDKPMLDFTGCRVVADKPVAVYAGGRVRELYATVSRPVWQCELRFHGEGFNLILSICFL